MSVTVTTAATILVKRHRLEPRFTAALVRVLTRAVLRRPVHGREVCREGEPGDELFFLIRGGIDVRKRDLRGEEQELAQLRAPAMLGHMALVGNAPRSATCVAGENCILGVLDRASFDALMEDPGEEGEALRWLILSSMLMQFGDSAEHLQQLMLESRETELKVGETSAVWARTDGWL